MLCRFLNADSADLLTDSQGGITDKNLFAYCDNNPVNRVDQDGDIWGLALAGGGALGTMGSSALVALGAIAPVGLAVVTVAVVAYTGYSIYKFSKGGRQNVRDTGLIGVSDTEIQNRLKDPRTTKSERNRLKKKKRQEEIEISRKGVTVKDNNRSQQKGKRR